MNSPVLSIDSATENLVVALAEAGSQGGRVYSRELVGMRQHAEVLDGFLGDVVRDAGIRWNDVVAVRAGLGPGAFVGIRVALSAAKGIALALGVPVLGFCTLAALAQSALVSPAFASRNTTTRTTKRVLAFVDARRGQVYTRAFLWSPGSKELNAIEDAFPLDAGALSIYAREFDVVVGRAAPEWNVDHEHLMSAQLSAGGVCAVSADVSGRYGTGLDLIPNYCREPDAKLPTGKGVNP